MTWWFVVISSLMFLLGWIWLLIKLCLECTKWETVKIMLNYVKTMKWFVVDARLALRSAAGRCSGVASTSCPRCCLILHSLALLLFRCCLYSQHLTWYESAFKVWKTQFLMTMNWLNLYIHLSQKKKKIQGRPKILNWLIYCIKFRY